MGAERKEMERRKMNAADYLKQKERVTPVILRIPAKLKQQWYEAAEKNNTTATRFVESALLFYLEALKKKR